MLLDVILVIALLVCFALWLLVGLFAGFVGSCCVFGFVCSFWLFLYFWVVLF